MALIDIFKNPVPRRYLDYTTNLAITGVPFAGDVNIPLEGRTKPVTDISEIAPTRSTRNVLAEGIANAAYRVDNTKTDWTKPFSTIVKGSGQPNIRSDVPTYDYSGYKLGNPEGGWKGKRKEFTELLKTLYGGSAGNIIANTLGDYTATYTPGVPQLGIEDVMNLYDRYDFVGKRGEGRGSAYEIDINLPPELLAQIKNYPAKRRGYKIWKHSTNRQIMNRRKKAMQQEIREAEKREKSYQDTVKKNIPVDTSITQKPKPKWTPPQQTGGDGGIHGGGGRPQKGNRRVGRMPIGTDTRNPWGRADGGLMDIPLTGRSRYI